MGSDNGILAAEKCTCSALVASLIVLRAATSAAAVALREPDIGSMVVCCDATVADAYSPCTHLGGFELSLLADGAKAQKLTRQFRIRLVLTFAIPQYGCRQLVHAVGVCVRGL